MGRRTRVMAGASVLATVLVVEVAQPEVAAAVTSVAVTTTADLVDGDPATTSLREAVDAANADGQATEIVLAPGATYPLTLCGPTDDDNGTGDLDHTDTAQLTIFANGSTIVQTCPGERVLEHLDPTTAIVLDGAVVSGGSVTGTAVDGNGDSVGGGGGVLSHGRGIFVGTTVTANAAEDLGAGVRVLKEATFTNSTVDGNTGGGGGAAVGRDNDFMFTSSVLTAVGSSFDANVGDGLAVFNGSGSVTSSTANANTVDGLVAKFAVVTIDQSELNDNGGFGADGLDGPLTLTNSEASRNGDDGLKSTGSGSLHLTGVDVLDNGQHGVRYIGCDGVGTSVVITVLGSTVADNGATGVFDDGCGGVEVQNTTVSGNERGIACSGCSSMFTQFSTVAGNGPGGGIEFVPDDEFVPSAGLLVRATSVTDNVSSGDGGGIAVLADGSFDVFATVSEASTVTGNTALDGDGGGIAVDGADFLLLNSTVNSNTAGDPDDQLNGPFGRGGGVFVRDGSLSIGLSGISANRANGDGGGVAQVGFAGDLANVFSLVAADNESNGTGGAIDVDGADGFTIGDSTLTGNTSVAQGGAIATRNTPTTIERSVVSGNSSGAVGAAIYGFENQNPGFGLLVDTSEVSGNAGPGAAVFASTIAPTTVRNSTVSGNPTVGVGASGNTSVQLEFATVVDNVGGNVATTGGNLSASASVVADAVGGANCAVGGFTLSSGSNADTDGSCGFSNISDLPGLASVGLGPLGSHGGPTDTHPVLAGSPLRDAVVPLLCAGVLTDQRGTVRPQGAACDVGAYEAQILPITGLVWETVARLGPIEFAIADLVDLGELRPDPRTVELLEVADGVDVVVEGGSLVFERRRAEDPTSATLIGEFPLRFEVCAVEDPGACGEGSVTLRLVDPAEHCTIEGTDRRDVLWGTRGDDVICAGAGDDIVLGLDGNDVIVGGPGRDIVLGGRGDDVVTGDEGRDLLLGQRGDDWLDGGDGRDTCLPSGGTTFHCEFPRGLGRR